MGPHQGEGEMDSAIALLYEWWSTFDGGKPRLRRHSEWTIHFLRCRDGTRALGVRYRLVDSGGSHYGKRGWPPASTDTRRHRRGGREVVSRVPRGRGQRA